ncbi:MAG: hypothetical protein V1779_14075 [bacterium]
MNKTILTKHITNLQEKLKKDSAKYLSEKNEREKYFNYYQNFTKEKILSMTVDDIYEYLSNLWAMLIWGNKHYVVDNVINDNGLENFKKELSELLFSKNEIAKRWDHFRSKIKGMGPAMISEILCKTFPHEFMLWNRRAFVALNYLEVDELPKYDYQLNGKIYSRLCSIAKSIAIELKKHGFEDDLLSVDYFIWEELQVERFLSKIHEKKEKTKINEPETKEESTFKHNDIRDKLREIGLWLGFKAEIERKVAAGSVVDTVWEATIGNMGRVIYVFEVQTKGSVDSLIVNLLKALNNPAVQGVVAVSDKEQLNKIKTHVAEVKNLNEKLKCWDYEEVLQVYNSLEFVNSTINNLKLVPDGF